METKFTKGPWTLGYGNGLHGDVISWQCYLDETNAVQLPIAKGAEAVAVINYSNGSGRSSEHKANAHLISAAPEMYEALESAVMAVNADIIRVRPSDREAFLGMLKSWNNALEKARGES